MLLKQYCFSAIHVIMDYSVLLLTALITTTYSYQPREEIVCAKQCACAIGHLSDMPMMKWLKIPMTMKSNESITDNSVLYDDEEEEIRLHSNPLINAAFCVVQDRSSSVTRSEFSKPVEALTVLHGPNTQNKTIEYEFDEFRELLALDIQGYQRQLHSNGTYSEVSLNHNALLQLQDLHYLNIQFVRLFPNPNSTIKQIPVEAYNSLPQRHHSNITFLLPSEPEVMPYNEYKKQKSIISTFTHLSNLQFLRLFHCQLEALTWEMFDGLFNLQTLSLEGNDIAEIPEYAFYGMPELKSLVLSHNKLTRIHNDSLVGLFKLESLDLSNNFLKHLSDSTFAPLPRLQHFNLQDNPIETISGNTFEVANMTVYLKIGSTDFLTVDENAFSGLTQLEKLELLGLNVTVLRKEILFGMPRLRHLRVGGQVEYITFDVFTGSPRLEELVLRNCSIQAVSIDAFYGLSHLRRLDLSWNELKTLPPGVFDQLESLRELILSHNRFTTVSGLVFHRLQGVEMIRLENNPWNCSCEMATWGSLNLDKIKVKRLVEHCSYQYDKRPCVTMEEIAYVYKPHVMPKCYTPAEYKDWNAAYVVDMLQCTRRRKRVLKKSGRIAKKVRPKMPEQRFVTEGSSGVRPVRSRTDRARVNRPDEIIRTTETADWVKMTTARLSDRNELSTARVNPGEGIRATETTEKAEWTTKNTGNRREVSTARANHPDEGIHTTQAAGKAEQMSTGNEQEDVDNTLGDLSQFLSQNENFGPQYRNNNNVLH